MQEWLCKQLGWAQEGAEQNADGMEGRGEPGAYVVSHKKCADFHTMCRNIAGQQVHLMDSPGSESLRVTGRWGEALESRSKCLGVVQMQAKGPFQSGDSGIMRKRVLGAAG